MNSILNSILNHKAVVIPIDNNPKQSKQDIIPKNNFDDIDDLKSKIDNLIRSKASVKDVHDFFMNYINILENIDDNESF